MRVSIFVWRTAHRAFRGAQICKLFANRFACPSTVFTRVRARWFRFFKLTPVVGTRRILRVYDERATRRTKGDRRNANPTSRRIGATESRPFSSRVVSFRFPVVSHDRQQHPVPRRRNDGCGADRRYRRAAQIRARPVSRRRPSVLVR